MTARRTLTTLRVFTLVCFIGVLAWLSVVIGIAAINLTVRSWCAPAVACGADFWIRLGIAAVGGIFGFGISGYALMNVYRERLLLLLGLAAALVTIGTGVWFWPIITG